MGLMAATGLAAGWSCTTSVEIPCQASSQCPLGLVCAEGLCRSDPANSKGRVRFLETIAGGDRGDGRLAAESILRGVHGLAVGDDGSIYIAELEGARIRRVNANGFIETIAGTGVFGFTDDTPAGGTTVKSAPVAVHAYQDLLYYIHWDYGNFSALKRIDVSTGIVDQFRIDGPASFDVTVDATTGDIYLAASNAHRIRQISAATGAVSDFAGTNEGFFGDGGPATAADLNFPTGVVVVNGVLYISDTDNNRIRAVNLVDGIITTYAGGDAGFGGDGQTAVNARFNQPRDLAVAGDQLVVVDQNNERLRGISLADDLVSTIAGGQSCCFVSDGDPANVYLPEPTVVAAGADGVVYVGDRRNGLVRRIGADGLITTFAGGADPHGDVGIESRVNAAHGLADDHAGGLVIADTEASRVLRLDRTSGRVTTVAGLGLRGFAGDGDRATQALLNRPRAVAVDSLGRIYIADAENSRVRRVDPATGIISTFAGGGQAGDGGPANQASFGRPVALAIDAEDNLYIADEARHRIRRVSPDNIITTFAGNGQANTAGDDGLAVDASINRPAGITVDSAGNVYIAEGNSHIIRRVDPAGTITRFAGQIGIARYCGDLAPALQACLAAPGQITAAPDGSLYIIDQDNQRIRHVDGETNLMSTVAGTGRYDFSGDGDASTSALLNPRGIAALSDGTVAFSEFDVGRIRLINQ
jgi:hypothetical protein